MKNALFASLVTVLVCSLGIVYAEEGFITSEKLSLDEVKGAVINHIKAIDKNGTFKELCGIYQGQDPTMAEVYWSAVLKGKLQKYSTSLVRFNSGKWFNDDIGEFLRK